MAKHYDFETSVGYWISVASTAFRRALNEELAPLGLTQRQSQVLCWLNISGTMTQTTLAGHLDIEAPTLAGILDRMELAGWVKRVSCPEDRRIKMVELQPAAEPVWEKIISCAEKIKAQALQGMNETEVAQLLSLLKRAHENLGRQESVTE